MALSWAFFLFFFFFWNNHSVGVINSNELSLLKTQRAIWIFSDRMHKHRRNLDYVVLNVMKTATVQLRRCTHSVHTRDAETGGANRQCRWRSLGDIRRRPIAWNARRNWRFQRYLLLRCRRPIRNRQRTLSAIHCWNVKWSNRMGSAQIKWENGNERYSDKDRTQIKKYADAPPHLCKIRQRSWWGH